MKPSQILKLVCEATEVTLCDLTGDNRLRHVVEARWIAAYLLRAQGYSFGSIGYWLGREHTSVMYGLRGIQKRPDAPALASGLLALTDNMAGSTV